MQWVIDNWQGVALVVTAVISLASAITALTPTPKDDAVVRKLYRIIEALGLVVGRAKDK